MSNINHVEGIHNDGAVSAIVAFELNGEAAFDQVVIPYKGMRPSQAYLDAYAQQITGCKTAQVVSYVNIDQGYGEDNYTCPDAHHVASMNKATAPAGNHYEPAMATTLGEAIIVKTKVVRMNQTTRSSQKN
jgi:hypothetical protein